MLGCDQCDEWFHYTCIGFIGSSDDAAVVNFVCGTCQITLSLEEKLAIEEKNKSLF